MVATRAKLGGFGLGLFLLAAGCAAPVRKTTAPVFFPAAPAPPRIQYLMSFSGLRDIEEETAFDRFVVGEKPDLKVDKPYGIAVYDGKVYVCDTNLTVDVFDFKKKTFSTLAGAVGPGALKQPINISVEKDGTKYVADPMRGQVVVFDRDDRFVRAYGIEGQWRPVDAVAYEDRVYVADVEKGWVRVFDKQTGQSLKNIGDRGTPAERLDRPTNLAFDSAGYLYVTDVGRFQVVKFDRDGHFKAAIGQAGDNLGHFARPKGIALDREGNLYVVDASFNNVQIFNKDARLLMFFPGATEDPGGLKLPAKVTVDYDSVRYFEAYADPGFKMEYLIFVTSQFGDKRVSVYGFGRQEGQRYPTDSELLKEIDERRRKETGT